MDDVAVARRYAKALLALGEELGNADVLAQSLESFGALMKSGDGSLLDALCHPAVNPAERRGVLDAVLGKVEIEPMVANFLRLVLDKDRAAQLPAIIVEVRKMVDAAAGRVAAVLTTASPISSELEQEVQSVLAAATGKTIRLETCVDPALIGGMVVQVGSKVYDASVRSQLESMRQSLLAGGAIATSVEA